VETSAPAGNVSIVRTRHSNILAYGPVRFQSFGRTVRKNFHELGPRYGGLSRFHPSEVGLVQVGRTPPNHLPSTLAAERFDRQAVQIAGPLMIDNRPHGEPLALGAAEVA